MSQTEHEQFNEFLDELLKNINQKLQQTLQAFKDSGFEQLTGKVNYNDLPSEQQKTLNDLISTSENLKKSQGSNAEENVLALTIEQLNDLAKTLSDYCDSLTRMTRDSADSTQSKLAKILENNQYSVKSKLSLLSDLEENTSFKSHSFVLTGIKNAIDQAMPEISDEGLENMYTRVSEHAIRSKHIQNLLIALSSTLVTCTILAGAAAIGLNTLTPASTAAAAMPLTLGSIAGVAVVTVVACAIAALVLYVRDKNAKNVSLPTVTEKAAAAKEAAAEKGAEAAAEKGAEAAAEKGAEAAAEKGAAAAKEEGAAAAKEEGAAAAKVVAAAAAKVVAAAAAKEEGAAAAKEEGAEEGEKDLPRNIIEINGAPTELSTTINEKQ